MSPFSQFGKGREKGGEMSPLSGKKEVSPVSKGFVVVVVVKKIQKDESKKVPERRNPKEEKSTDCSVGVCVTWQSEEN